MRCAASICAVLLCGCTFDRSGVASATDAASSDRPPLLEMGPPHDAPRAESLPPDAAPDGPRVDLALLDSLPPADIAIPPDTQPTPDTAAAPLFEDDFTTAGGLVDDGTGSWSTLGGELRQLSCIYTPEAVAPGKSWTDVAVRVRLRGDQYCTSYQQAGLVIRVTGYTSCAGNKYYWCLADFDNDEIRIGKMNGACTTGNWSLKPIPPIDLNVWYWMELSAKGNTVTCTMWGGNLPSTQTHTFVDGGTPYASGSAGVVTAGLQASFDDFSVWAN